MISVTADVPMTQGVSRRYAWLVFALTFGLLLSDYMSRQVLNAVFPLLKAEWQLSDTQLGSLSGIVALAVGVLTFPLSLLADRLGRVRSLTIMALLWSLATLACGLAESYPQMFAARLMVGIGEAAYGSVGLAVVLSVFPVHMRATLTSAFMAGGLVGSLLGMGAGGVVAVHFGWRWSFAAMALFGLALALTYPLVVRNSTEAEGRKATAGMYLPLPWRTIVNLLFMSRTAVCVYIGSGLQLFTSGALLAWIATYLSRYYQLPTDKAGLGAAAFVLSSSVGMIACGVVTDRLSRRAAKRKMSLAIAYCLISASALLVAFRLPMGPGQLALICIGMFTAAGTTGPAGAAIANLVPASIHSTALATFTLANNFLGLAPGPIVTGFMADRVGLLSAFQWIPLTSLVALLAFAFARQTYDRDLRNRTSALPRTEEAHWR